MSVALRLLHMPVKFIHRAVCSLLLSGDLAASSGDYPVLPEWEKDWSPKTGVKLESAYRQVDGKEPDFTNNAKVRFVCCLGSFFSAR